MTLSSLGEIAVVVGNPRAGSRTRDAAERLAAELGRVAGRDTAPTPGAEPAVVELGELGPALFDPGADEVTRALRVVADAELVIVASPTYKATYTGLLKLFLDLLPTGEGLRDTVAVPLMLGAGPAHALAPEVFLKPVLAELGAVTPAPGLYLSDSTYTSDGRIERYVERWGSALTG